MRNGIAAGDVLVYVEGGGAFDNERGAAAMPHSVCLCAEFVSASVGQIRGIEAGDRTPHPARLL
jgi:hypothetical protein